MKTKSESETDLLIKEGEGLTVEFKEKYSPRIAQDIVAFANTRGGKLLLGVADDRTIKGEKLTNKMKAEIIDLARNCDPPIYVTSTQVGEVVVIDIPAGEEPPYQCSQGHFKRLDGITQKLKSAEVKKFFNDYRAKMFEGTPANNCKLSDIAIEKVKKPAARLRAL